MGTQDHNTTYQIKQNKKIEIWNNTKQDNNATYQIKQNKKMEGWNNPKQDYIY